jgi:hypothetical protein
MATRHDYRHVMDPRLRDRIIVRMATIPLPTISNPPHRHHPQNRGGRPDVIAIEDGSPP